MRCGKSRADDEDSKAMRKYGKLSWNRNTRFERLHLRAPNSRGNMSSAHSVCKLRCPRSPTDTGTSAHFSDCRRKCERNKPQMHHALLQETRQTSVIVSCAASRRLTRVTCWLALMRKFTQKEWGFFLEERKHTQTVLPPPCSSDG